ncbi:MAG: glycosyl transferase [Bacteroidales bacterium]|nr:glycosyl transferase [Bacteroidales bacterium]
MIPKIIHYCWFGGKPLPKLALKCKDSWQRFFPDYEIKEWNESNFDVNVHPYTQYCYEHQLWAYLSDYVRLCVVEREGGIYFDTDVEVVKHPEELLKSCHAYFGWETPEYINTGLGFAAEAHHPAVKAMLSMYEGLVAHRKYKYEKMQGCPQLNTEALDAYGLRRDGTMQEVCGSKILPIEYLCPFHDATGTLLVTGNTISIHWFSKSPHGQMAVWKMKVTRPLHRFLAVFNKKK